MAKISLKFLFLAFLLISQIDIRLADDGDEEASEGGTTEADAAEAGSTEGAPSTEGEEESTEGKSSEKKSGGKDPEFSSDELQKKYEKIKNNKNSNPMKGKSGKIMQIVVEAIKEINPVRLIQDFDPNPLLTVNGIDVEKLQFPVNYLSDSFFDKFAAKCKKSKKELSKELGVDIEAKKEGEWISVGKLLKVGHKFNLKLGDYLNFLGLDMSPYEKRYDDYLIETVRVPVEFIDEVSTEGLTKYLNIIREYIGNNGGAVNSALKAYGDYTGKDVVNETQQAIKKMKTYNVTAAQNHSKAKYEKQYQQYKDQFNKQIQFYYNDWFGKGGRFFVYQRRITGIINNCFKSVQSFYSGQRFDAALNMVGSLIGPEGRAIAYIVYQPTAVMLNQIFGPFLLIPRIFMSDGDIWEKLLAMPPVIIQTSAGIFKPALMVVEPFIRLGRFLVTGEYTKSLSAGLDVSASYGISIWGGAFKPKRRSKGNSKETSKPGKKSAPKKRSKRQLQNLQNFSGNLPNIPNIPGSGKAKTEKPRMLTPEEAARYTKSDKRMADAYQGGPPPGGYKLGVKNDGKIDLDDEDMISRALLSPDFILKAGGPVFVPFASVLAPSLRIVNTVLFGKGDFNQRMANVPEIMRGVGLIGPLADVVQALLPFIKMGYLSYKGNLSASQAIVQMPGLIKQLTSGVLYNVYKNPYKLFQSMIVFLEGHGGIIAMLKLQANGNVPTTDPGAAEEAKIELGEEANLILRFMGDFFGGWLLVYLQALGPVGSLQATFFNGVLGNIVDPVKFMDTDPNLKMQPLKNLINIFDDLPRMFKCAAEKRNFLAAVLGGQDPDVLNEIGISAEKLVEHNIDPAYLLAGGKKALPSDVSKKLDESSLEKMGIQVKLLAKVNIDAKAFLESGLLTAKEEKLQEMGIDMHSFFNRLMRGSVEDEDRLLKGGIDLRIMLKVGVCPARLLTGGVQSLPPEQLRAAGIKDPKELTDDDVKALGLNPTKLHSKGINAKKLAQEGVESFAHLQGNIGINANTLLTSMYTGLDPKRVKKAGIDIKAMVKAGIDTKLLLTGGIRKQLKGDSSSKGLQKVGINATQFNHMGINVKLIGDIGAAVLNPLNLVKMGIDPMSTLITTLSRHGLDMMTGGIGDPVAVSFGFINSILKIINNAIRLVPRIRELPGGKTIIGPDGRFVGAAGFLFYNIIGIDNTGGLIGLLQKIYSGKFSLSEILRMVNPIRITNAIANPNVKASKGPMITKRVKQNPQSIGEYVNKSQNMRIGQTRGTGKSSIYGTNDEDTYDESKLITTLAPIESSEGDEATTEAQSSKSKYGFPNVG